MKLTLLVAVVVLAAASKLAAAEPAIDGLSGLKLQRVASATTQPVLAALLAACQASKATACLYARQPSTTPMAMADEVAASLQQACNAAQGVFDNPADIEIITRLQPSPPRSFRTTKVITTDHSCRRGRHLGGARATTYDFGSLIDGPVQPDLGSKFVIKLFSKSRGDFEAITGVLAFSESRVALRQAEIKTAKIARCERVLDSVLAEGAETTIGLIIERRQRVALVQPANGMAKWVPVDSLQPVAPSCSG